MMEFLLLHGAWHGAWVWDEVASRLLGDGCKIQAPDLPGLGQDRLSLSPSIDLETHLQAVLPEKPCVICAHSYAGMLARLIVERRPQCVQGLVLVEALWPQHGQCAMDMIAPGGRDALQKRIDEEGDGWRIPPPPVSQFDINDARLERAIENRLSDHPASTFRQTVSLRGPEAVGTYLIADDRESQPYAAIASELELKGWSIEHSSGGHSLMLTRPDVVTRILRALA